jgi:hypothetical protein
VAAPLDPETLLPVVADALRARRDGHVERPDRPHFPVADAPIRVVPTATRPGALVVAVGACTAETRAVDARTVQRARRRPFADVPDEAAGAGDLAAVGVDGSRLRPVADLFDGEGWAPGPRLGPDDRRRERGHGRRDPRRESGPR